MKALRKLYIYTGMEDGKRFFDHYHDLDAFYDDETDVIMHTFALSDDELEAGVREMAENVDIFLTCLGKVPRSDINRYLHNRYRNEDEFELINNAIRAELEKIVIDDWINDCLDEVKGKYE